MGIMVNEQLEADMEVDKMARAVVLLERRAANGLLFLTFLLALVRYIASEIGYIKIK